MFWQIVSCWASQKTVVCDDCMVEKGGLVVRRDEIGRAGGKQLERVALLQIQETEVETSRCGTAFYCLVGHFVDPVTGSVGSW